VQLRLQEGDGTGRPIDIDVHTLIIAGMTGRDTDAVQEHIDELSAIGIAPPSTIPIYYRVSATMVINADAIQVIGGDSSGEVEAVLIGTDDGMVVGVGSDHTDRRVEADSVAIAKQICPKPIATEVWRFADVVEAWDDLELICDRVDDGKSTPYQRGRMAAVRRPEDLIAGYFDGCAELPPGVVMFTGTVPTIGDIAPAGRFEIALNDPDRRRRLSHAYAVEELPVMA
jgi:hypothetical protein